MRALEFRDYETEGHCERVTKYALKIAKELNFTEQEMTDLEYASILHDVGKISIPEWVIDKSTKLQKLIDGFELIKLRAEIIKRDLKI